MSNPATDLQFTNLGFAIACQPLTDMGREWLLDNVPDYQEIECGGAPEPLPLYIEPRYLEDIVTGAMGAGMVCNG